VELNDYKNNQDHYLYK